MQLSKLKERELERYLPISQRLRKLLLRRVSNSSRRVKIKRESQRNQARRI
jgi:hypothetical protein